MRRQSHTRLIKQVNIGTLLKDIRTWGPISRAELVKTSELSPTTVSVLVEELLQAGLVQEIGTGESSGGRRPVLLEFQPRARLALGIDIGVHKTTIALLDLDGRTIKEHSYTPNLKTKEIFLHDIIEHTLDVLASLQHLKDNILGIGVATPGLLDREKHNILYSSSLGFSNVPLYKTLKENLDLPVRIDNDMNAAALGEKLMGAGKKLDNLIYISVEKGIGAGIIINNRVYDGATGSAGEFGHTKVDSSGALCTCGNRGCLGVMAAEPAILNRAIHILTIGAETKMREYHTGQPAQINFESIVSAVHENDQIALSIINDCFDYLAIGIANLINMFDPAAIIIGGSTIDALQPFALERIRNQVQQRVLPFHAERICPIIPSELKKMVKIIGASTLIFSEFLDYPDVLTVEQQKSE